MRYLLGVWLVILGVVVLFVGLPLVSPVWHLVLLLVGTISPSWGNISVVAGEFVIFAAVSGSAYVFLRTGARFLEGETGVVC